MSSSPLPARRPPKLKQATPLSLTVKDVAIFLSHLPLSPLHTPLTIIVAILVVVESGPSFLLHGGFIYKVKSNRLSRN